MSRKDTAVFMRGKLKATAAICVHWENLEQYYFYCKWGRNPEATIVDKLIKQGDLPRESSRHT